MDGCPNCEKTRKIVLSVNELIRKEEERSNRYPISTEMIQTAKAMAYERILEIYDKGESNGGTVSGSVNGRGRSKSGNRHIA